MSPQLPPSPSHAVRRRDAFVPRTTVFASSCSEIINEMGEPSVHAYARIFPKCSAFRVDPVANKQTTWEMRPPPFEKIYSCFWRLQHALAGRSAEVGYVVLGPNLTHCGWPGASMASSPSASLPPVVLHTPSTTTPEIRTDRRHRAPRRHFPSSLALSHLPRHRSCAFCPPCTTVSRAAPTDLVLCVRTQTGCIHTPRVKT